MHPPYHIRLLSRKQIDDALWNSAVDRDDACLIYGLTWWLDAATDYSWEGLVLGDYEIVFPLPHAHKIGPFRRIIRAPFTQQCGPFGNPNPDQARAMLAAIPKTLQLDLPLHESIDPGTIPARFAANERTNLVLDISRPYESIRKDYGKTLKRRLKKAGPVSAGPTYPQAILDLYRQSSGRRANLRDAHYERITALMEACLQRGSAIFHQVLEWDHGHLLANGFFPVYRGRITHLFPGTTPLGYETDGAMRLLDSVIRERAETDFLFDFEGSDLTGVAQMFQRFKPERRPYFRIS